MLLIQTAQVVVIYGNDLYQQLATVEKKTISLYVILCSQFYLLLTVLLC